MDKLSYRRHRFPSIVIQQAVWLYFRKGMAAVIATVLAADKDALVVEKIADQ